MPIKIVKLKTFIDHRGTVFEPLTADEQAKYKNSHVVITLPGKIRGNHYHLNGPEIMVIMGPALFTYRNENEIESIALDKTEVFKLLIPPQISHAIKNSGTMPMVLISFTPLAYNPQNPDVVPDLLIK